MNVDAYDHLDETSDPVLDYALDHGFANLQERVANGDALREHAHKLLLVLLAGVGGALTVGRTVLDGAPVPPSVAGAAALALWWCCVAAMLAMRCLTTRDTWPVHNEAGNLYRPEVGWGLQKLRRRDLFWLQKRTDATKDRNDAVALWFDRCLWAALAGVPVFALAALLSRYWA